MAKRIWLLSRSMSAFATMSALALDASGRAMSARLVGKQTSVVSKAAHGSADLREGASEEKTVPRIVEPPRCAARMRQRDVRDPLDPSRRPDRDFEAHLPPEAFDRETADEQDHARSKERELLLEPR